MKFVIGVFGDAEADIASSLARTSATLEVELKIADLDAGLRHVSDFQAVIDQELQDACQRIKERLTQ